MDKVSMSYLFSFSGYQTKCVLNVFLFRQLIILQSNGRHAEKEGKAEIQKIEYLEKEKSFLFKVNESGYIALFVVSGSID